MIKGINMKKLILGTMFALVSLTAFADPATVSITPSVTNTNLAATTGVNSGASAGASNQGNTQSLVYQTPSTIHQTIDGTQTIRNTPSVSGPMLTTSNDTCMGSTSGSVNIAGLGLGGGSTYVDENCKRLKNSRELWNMGMKAASLALMCNDPANREALEVTGFACPVRATPGKTTSSNGNSSIVANPLALNK